MAKAPKKKQEKKLPQPAFKHEIGKENLFEGYKNYKDFLDYAQKFNKPNSTEAIEAKFPYALRASAQEAFSPYYGSDYERQQAAAAEYARQLAVAEAQENSKPLVQIDSKYYEELQRKIPINSSYLFAPHYNILKDEIFLPRPPDAAESDMSLTDKELAKNNYGSKEDLARAISNKLGDYYRDIAEHELGHVADRHVKFSEKPPYTDMSAPKSDLGYMGRENHLVTGLGKIQRELYARTGSRIESPDQFKQFVFDLAKSKNIEEAISGFSEEAKRAIRPQIQNAKEVQKYYDQVDAWEKNKSWLKGNRPKVPEIQLDFLEKSALLIPALVQIGTRNKSSV